MRLMNSPEQPTIMDPRQAVLLRLERRHETDDHPYNRDHACLTCQYRCACRDVPLTCETCGTVYPPRGWSGTPIEFCSKECDPNLALRWASPFVDTHLYAPGCCEVPDYMHVQAPRTVDRVEAASLGLGGRRTWPREPVADVPPALAALAPRVITRNLHDGGLHLRSQVAGQLVADDRCAGTTAPFARLRTVPEGAGDAMCAICWPTRRGPVS